MSLPADGPGDGIDLPAAGPATGSSQRVERGDQPAVATFSRQIPTRLWSDLRPSTSGLVVAWLRNTTVVTSRGDATTTALSTTTTTTALYCFATSVTTSFVVRLTTRGHRPGSRGGDSLTSSHEPQQRGEPLSACPFDRDLHPAGVDPTFRPGCSSRCCRPRPAPRPGSCPSAPARPRSPLPTRAPRSW